MKNNPSHSDLAVHSSTRMRTLFSEVMKAQED